MAYADEGRNRDGHYSGGSSMNATTFEGGGGAMVPAAAALGSEMTGTSGLAANMIYGSYGVARPMGYQPTAPAAQQYSLPQHTTFVHPTGVTGGTIGAPGLAVGQVPVVYPYGASSLLDSMMSMGYANRKYDHTNDVQSYEYASTSGTPGLPRTYIPETQNPLGNQTHAFLRQRSSSGMARSLASAVNGSKMNPLMQSAVISGQLPEMKVGDKLVFGNVRAAHGYLRQPKLTPTMGNTGCPVTSSDAMHCIRKIYNALISVDAVWDKEVHSEDCLRFLDGGAWSDPKDLQAVTFHISGTLGGMHKGQQQGAPLQFPDLREPTPQDVAFTFHQRLHWTCFLLKHYKSHANRFMCKGP